MWVGKPQAGRIDWQATGGMYRGVVGVGKPKAGCIGVGGKSWKSEAGMHPGGGRARKSTGGMCMGERGSGAGAQDRDKFDDDLSINVSIEMPSPCPASKSVITVNHTQHGSP